MGQEDKKGHGQQNLISFSSRHTRKKEKTLQKKRGLFRCFLSFPLLFFLFYSFLSFLFFSFLSSPFLSFVFGVCNQRV